jgi:hypothetical protein
MPIVALENIARRPDHRPVRPVTLRLGLVVQVRRWLPVSLPSIGGSEVLALARYSGGIRLPRAERGPLSLWSLRQASIGRLASAMDRNQWMFRHSSRSDPSNVSI